jgi:hypothetical protein
MSLDVGLLAIHYKNEEFGLVSRSERMVKESKNVLFRLVGMACSDVFGLYCER